jgi:hypothetical protein
MCGNHLLRHEANSWLKLGRQQSEKAEVIVITKIMPYSGTNQFFTGTMKFEVSSFIMRDSENQLSSSRK